MDSIISKGLEKYTINNSEVDDLSCLKISSLLHLFIVSTEKHIADIDVLSNTLQELNLYLGLSRVSLEIESFPKLGNDITIVSWFRSIDSVFVYRDFLVFGTNDMQKPLIKATTAWTLLNIESRRPQKNDIIEGIIPFLDSTCGLEELPTKVDALPCAWSHSSGVVTSNDVDANGFASKSICFEWIANIYSKEHHDEMTIKRVDVNFISDAVLGDTFKVNMASKGNGVYLNNVVKDADQKELVRTRIYWLKR